MTAHDLLDRVHDAGYRVTVTDSGAPRLVKHDREAAPVPIELLQLLKEHRAEVLEAIQGCERCGRAVSAEDAGVLANLNVLCVESGCPYRRRERR